MTVSPFRAAPRFQRELPEFVSVRVDGAYESFDPDITERTPGRSPI